jgi:hypothetical protein
VTTLAKSRRASCAGVKFQPMAPGLLRNGSSLRAPNTTVGEWWRSVTGRRRQPSKSDGRSVVACIFDENRQDGESLSTND